MLSSPVLLVGETADILTQISIRIAGIDAPECSHFGRPAQPFSAEALDWLSSYILNRNVRTYVYKRDQFDRIVGTVYVRKWLIRRNVGLEMIKRGLATVYEAKSGAEFGGLKDVYIKAEAKAKRKKKGMRMRTKRRMMMMMMRRRRMKKEDDEGGGGTAAAARGGGA